MGFDRCCLMLPLFVIKRTLEPALDNLYATITKKSLQPSSAAGHHLDHGITLLPYKHNRLKAFDEHPITLNSDD